MNTLKLFGESGMIALAMQRAYEYRPQQREMAAAVEKALENKTHLIVEAGTGVGKSLAYLVPLVLRAREENQRAVVATYTKALQQQLVDKDLPFLRSVLGDFRYALCVGGENYLCLRRFDHLRIGNLYEQNEIEPLNRLFAWSTMTRTGLRSELDIEPSAGLWGKACRQADLCFGKDCSYYKDCFYMKAKAIEQQAHILVANHHLFFADMATGGNVLPLHKVVVFDEAHQIEDVATDYLGVEVTNFAVRYLLDTLLSQRTRRGMLTRLSIQDPDTQVVHGMVDGLRVISDNFFLNLQPLLLNNPALRIRRRNIVPDILSEPLMELRDALLQLKAGTPGGGTRDQGPGQPGAVLCNRHTGESRPERRWLRVLGRAREHAVPARCLAHRCCGDAAGKSFWKNRHGSAHLGHALRCGRLHLYQEPARPGRTDGIAARLAL